MGEKIKKSLNIGLVKDEIAKPLEEKLKLANSVIQLHLFEFKPEECYVAWSGGKDSTLVLYLVRQFAPDIPVVFDNTTAEFPQTVKFVRDLAREWGLNFTELHPEKTFWECIEEYGFPLYSRYRASHEGGTGRKTGTPACCRWLKEKPVIKFIKENGMKAGFIGLTAGESWTRRIAARRFGICHHSKYYGVCRIKPILYFRPDEVWYLTKEWKIPINPVYELIPRVGCMPCSGHIGWEKQIARQNPRLYEFIMRKMGRTEYQLPLFKHE